MQLQNEWWDFFCHRRRLCQIRQEIKMFYDDHCKVNPEWERLFVKNSRIMLTLILSWSVMFAYHRAHHHQEILRMSVCTLSPSSYSPLYHTLASIQKGWKTRFLEDQILQLSSKEYILCGIVGDLQHNQWNLMALVLCCQLRDSNAEAFVGDHQSQPAHHHHACRNCTIII